MSPVFLDLLIVFFYKVELQFLEPLASGRSCFGSWNCFSLLDFHLMVFLELGWFLFDIYVIICSTVFGEVIHKSKKVEW